MEQYSVQYGQKKISFYLSRKDVKNVNLNVKPDMTVMVSANKRVPLDFIKGYVKSKGNWILKQQNLFEKTRSEENDKEFVSGETIRYLGKQYRLRVIEGEEEIKFSQGYIHLWVKNKNDYKKKKELVQGWLRQRAKLVFEGSLERMYRPIKKYGIKKPELRIRQMRARWGSCIKDKKIILLNLDLIKAPKACVDYVVMHELIHFKYSGHNKEFYSFLTALMPDWKKRKEILDQEVVREL